jgi:ElaB/YqjD/DUF883 family membrane-anchored ribosome-binding protein
MGAVSRTHDLMETYFYNMAAEEGTKEKLIQDLMVLLRDAEELIKVTGENVGRKSKEELMAALAKAKTTCQRVERRAAAGAQSADRVIRDYPYASMGIVFGLGLFIGILANRR